VAENYINHIALVLDASGSMEHLREMLVQVADAQIAHLAQRSKELDQETRVTVYTFDSEVRCAVYERDALRLPSIRQHYRTGGSTALIDATIQSQDDLAKTAQLYGDHAFLTYVLTDGCENASQTRPDVLAKRLADLPDNWTVAVFVPDPTGKFEAKRFGFPPDNVAIWDTSAKGLVEVGETIRQVTDTYMRARTTGLRGSRSLFSTSVDALNPQSVRAARLDQLPEHQYAMLSVDREGYIKEWVESRGFPYIVGTAFYELTKTESIQAAKAIAVVEKATGHVFTGRGARDLLGLPAMEVRVKPDYNPLYDVFVQSTSTNRRLVPRTRLLLLR
jgi:hypothetical protein